VGEPESGDLGASLIVATETLGSIRDNSITRSNAPSAAIPRTTKRPCGAPRHRPTTTTGRSARTSGNAGGSRSNASKPCASRRTAVRTGASTQRRKRSARAAASSARSTTNGSAFPARAIPSIRKRLTDEPMPKANRLASPRLARISSNVSRSALT